MKQTTEGKQIMRILFYVQPNTEEGAPFFRRTMVEQFVTPFVDALYYSPRRNDFEFHLATNETLLGIVDNPITLFP